METGENKLSANTTSYLKWTKRKTKQNKTKQKKQSKNKYNKIIN